MNSIDFNEPYVINILNNFNNLDETEFENASSIDDGISDEDHIAFVEAIENLSGNLSSCVLGMFEARQDDNKIASIGMLKMLSSLFSVGREASEDRFKINWNKDGAKKIEKKIQLYENLCDTIQPEQHQQNAKSSKSLKAMGNTVTKDVKQEQPEFQESVDNFQQENPDSTELSGDDENSMPQKRKPASRNDLLNDDSDENVIPVKRKRSKPASGAQSKLLNSSTESSCKKEDETTDVFPVISRLENRPVKQPCITYENGIKVGYSDLGVKPILIVNDPDDEDIAYSYRCMRPGVYRCLSCGLFNVHRYAALFNEILYSHIHECKGIPRTAIEAEQRTRARKYENAPLPSLSELSGPSDPRPFPAYPKSRPRNRGRNPHEWKDRIEFSNFETCLLKKIGVPGFVAYPDSDPTMCYEYEKKPKINNSYLCTSCLKNRKHTLAKFDKNETLLISASHNCHGYTIEEYEAIQDQRRQRNSELEYDDSDN